MSGTGQAVGIRRAGRRIASTRGCGQSGCGRRHDRDPVRRIIDGRLPGAGQGSKWRERGKRRAHNRQRGRAAKPAGHDRDTLVVCVQQIANYPRRTERGQSGRP